MREALQKSTDKWQAIVDGSGVDKGWENCALCSKFICNESCHGCPVATDPGNAGCENTPYIEWSIHHGEVHGTEDGDKLRVECPECQRLAQAELDYLKGLL